MAWSVVSNAEVIIYGLLFIWLLYQSWALLGVTMLLVTPLLGFRLYIIGNSICITRGLDRLLVTPPPDIHSQTWTGYCHSLGYWGRGSGREVRVWTCGLPLRHLRAVSL